MANEINEQDLIALQIKLGPRKKLLQILQEFKKDVMENNSLITFVNQTTYCNETETEISDTTSILLTQQYNQNRNLTAILQEDKNGKYIANKLLNKENLSVKELNTFNRILVDDLINVCGNYPKTEDKTNLARAIVSSYPQLGQYTCPDIPAHALWFDPKGSPKGKKASGKIEFRLQHVRLTLSPSKKKNEFSAKRQKENIKPNKDPNINANLIAELKTLIPTEQNFNRIKYLMNETFENRRFEIGHLKILDTYPIFLAYKGAIIENEFELLKNNRSTIQELENFNLEPFYRKETEFLQCENLRKIFTLLKMLPSRNLKKANALIASNLDDWEKLVAEEDLKPLVQWIDVRYKSCLVIF
ncbi:uncharacterized protein LOC129618477 [Condylostylus longicornis]|uniref:uncharacterized protein LOC129618477 n=1 Tax=Condylostylus longicornis TaxID=2530218 RepID=UPI00244E306E|nr:uncharacterized protein LOC129618477 [Condylostylus longicornis]